MALSGCAEKPDRPVLHPVQGHVLYNGKAPQGAVVRFVPLPLTEKPHDGLQPHGRVEADGSFAISSFASSDGAPEGEYAVTVTWTGEGGGFGPDRFGLRYQNPNRPVCKFTVKPGANTLETIRLAGPALK